MGEGLVRIRQPDRNDDAALCLAKTKSAFEINNIKKGM
jgi:hypothetical protein